MHKVLIVDDHALMRKGVKTLLLDTYPTLEIFEAENGDALLGYFKQQKIDILVMDVQMPNTDSISLVELISIKYPATYILIFSMLPERIYGQRLLKAGAMGYLPKESSLEDMRKAFEIVLQSKRFVSAELAEAISKSEIHDNSYDPFSALSFREFEILNFILSGSSINVVAQTLNLKPSTVGTYKSRIFEKLQVNNVFQLKDLAMLYKFNPYRLQRL